MENSGELRKIFIIDDNIVSLTTASNLLKPYYKVYPAQSAAMLFSMLQKAMPDVILLDIAMPDMDGYETIRRLKAARRFCEIPVIFLTGKRNERSEIQGFELGAADYISKPFSPPLLKKRIENQILILEQRETIQRHVDSLMTLMRNKTTEILGLQNAVLHTVADLVEFRDPLTGGHITRTQQYMEALLNGVIQKGAYAEVTVNWDMDFILPSAQLHDVGMIAIPDAILNKPSKLTPEEFETMKTHVTVGMDAVKRIMANAPNHSFLQHALNIVSGHHEKWDGTGYPGGLAGENIPLEGHLMGLVDVYDALVSWRPYKKLVPHEEAVEIIKQDSGTHLDPRLVEIFLSVEKKFGQITQKEVQVIA